jgi:hypothetical protein
MDPQRKAALLQRRQELRRDLERASQLYGLEELKSALEAAGEPHEILYAGEEPSWALAWIPWGYSRVPWDKVRPAEEIWYRSDLGARDEAAASALARLATPEEPLLVVFEGRAASFRMSRAVLTRNIPAVLDAGYEPVWITAPPKQWLVEVSREDVRVGDAPGAAGAASETESGFVLAPVIEVLGAAGTPYLVFDDADPGRPPLPDIPYGELLPSLRLTLAAADRALVRRTILGFVAERAAPDAPVQVAAPAGPRLQLGRAAFERHIEAFPYLLHDLNISAPGAAWGLAVRPRAHVWLQGIG